MVAESPLSVDASVIDLLIKKGCDVTLQDKVTSFSWKLKRIYKRDF